MPVFHVEDRDISVKVGERFTIELQSLGTAGYEWTVQIDEDKLERMEHSTVPSHEIGGSGVETLTFRPSKKGDTAIRLELKRPWEPKAARTHVIQAHIA